jgi:WD40 repeat protein
MVLGLLLLAQDIRGRDRDPKRDDERIARLVKQLGDDKFARREKATKLLKQIGEPALDALDRARKSNDPEVRRRAEKIVAEIEKKLYEDHVSLTGHEGNVWNVCISADGKRVLTSSADKTLRIWDADTGKCLHVLKGHTERIVGAALSKDGKRALSGSDDRTIRLWDTTTGKELDKLTGHAQCIWSVAFGPEGEAISGCCDGTVHRWDLKTGRNLDVFLAHVGAVRSVAYNERAKLAASANGARAIHLWDLKNRKVVRTFTEVTSGWDVNLVFSPDGKFLVANNSAIHAVHLWDVETGKEVKRFPVPNGYCMAFSPDGKRLVTGGYEDKTVRVWEVESGKELRKYEGHSAGVLSVAYFPDGKRIASACGDGNVRIWRAPR